MAVRILFLFPLSLLLFNCENPIKNTKEKVIVEKGTKVITASDENLPKEGNKISKTDSTKLLIDSVSNTFDIDTSVDINSTSFIGFWVGYFEKDLKEKYDQTKDIYADEGFYWARQNKINISIDTIIGNKVIGHSVVAGNNRPFIGTISPSKEDQNSFDFFVKEPGDNVYDGEFKFSISNNKLIGKWKAYKKIDIQKRKYELQKREFEYDSSIMLERNKAFLNWKKFITDEEEYTEEEIKDMGDWKDELINKEFSTTTDSIYFINASSTLLTKEKVENLKKGDLLVIRNAIYARHGYSFKNRQLRVFFDAQPWYIPVHSDIKKELTDIEKKNIRLLLKYEKNAVEYYDYFGRG